jgi:hypothetical protein
MPAFRIAVDDVVVATISTDGHDIIAIRVAGQRHWEMPAMLSADGGKYPKDAPSTHLIWIPEQALRIGQRVDIDMLADGVTAPPGRTIAELYPDEPEVDKDYDFTLTDEKLAELAKLEVLHPRHAFEFRGSDGACLSARTQLGDDGYSLTVLWDWARPAQARLMLGSSNLADARAGIERQYYARENLAVGASISLLVKDAGPPH